MAGAVPAADAPRVSRLDRRKARTRQALIDAAVRLIAEGRGDRASIAEITEEADIGFGSFYGDAVRSPAYREAKARTLLETATEVMGPSAGAPPLDLTDDLGRVHRHPAIVLVSNNPYALNGNPLDQGCSAVA